MRKEDRSLHGAEKRDRAGALGSRLEDRHDGGGGQRQSPRRRPTTDAYVIDESQVKLCEWKKSYSPVGSPMRER